MFKKINLSLRPLCLCGELLNYSEEDFLESVDLEVFSCFLEDEELPEDFPA